MTKKNINKLSFEESINELEEIINNFETGQIDLEQAIRHYSRGDELKKHCENKLQEAKLKVDKIIQTPDGKITTEEFTN